jgi:hypothetical protein
MIKAIGGRPGDQVVVLGLSYRNLERMRGGEPILADLAALGLPGLKVAIFTGPTEEQMEAELAPLLGNAERIAPRAPGSGPE